MTDVAQGELWWADVPDPSGTVAGFRRPVVIVQGNSLNRSRVSTVVCVPLTTNVTWASAPGNTMLPASVTGLPKDSVANATQLFAIDRAHLRERTGKLSPKRLDQILSSIDVVLGR